MSDETPASEAFPQEAFVQAVKDFAEQTSVKPPEVVFASASDNAGDIMRRVSFAQQIAASMCHLISDANGHQYRIARIVFEDNP